MKLKYSILLTVLCLIGMARLGAQPIRFQVQSPEGEPLPYCYVFINQNLWGATDLSGEAAIPDSQLHLGDSLTFHYIGNNDAVLVWAGQTENEITGLCFGFLDLQIVCFFAASGNGEQV